jgi:PAS domain S-box-containing protein
MRGKPTYEELEQRVKELEKAVVRHKLVEETLKKSEARLQNVLSAGPAVIYVCEPVGNYAATYVSRNIKEQLGYEPHEFLEDPNFWADHIYPEDRQRVLEQLPHVFRHDHHTHEYRFQDKLGMYKWMRDELRLVRDEQGKPMEIVGYWINITERKQAEEALRENTRRLEVAYAQSIIYAQELNEKITEHKRAEEAIYEREETLKAQAHELEEMNTALKVLLKQRGEDKAELEEKVLSNVEELVLPYVEMLKKSRLGAEQMTYVSILESNLTGIVSPFLRKLSSKYLSLTPQEIQIADLIKLGNTTKQIAGLLKVSTRAVEFHRGNMRRKLGLKNKKANLRSYLISIQ